MATKHSFQVKLSREEYTELRCYTFEEFAPAADHETYFVRQHLVNRGLLVVEHEYKYTVAGRPVISDSRYRLSRRGELMLRRVTPMNLRSQYHRFYKAVS